MKLKVRTPRHKRQLEVHGSQGMTVGEAADSAARQSSYHVGNHTLAHDGEILRRELQLSEVLNYADSKPQFELVLR
ncbi:MAG: hypothetical protein QOF36_2564 [Microbacteriaceae bacterium]|nr:hypothetical protein [Microbacteriaceae bacterium]